MSSHSTQAPNKNLLRAAFKRVRAMATFGLGIVFLVFVTIIVAGLWLRYDETLRKAQHSSQRIVDILSQQLVSQISSIEEILRELAAYSRFIGGPRASGQEWMPVLNVVSAGHHAVEALMVTDANGSVTYSSLPIFMGESRADGISFRELSANPRSDDLVVDEPIRSSNDSKIIVPLGRVIRTPQAEFEGMAIANLAPDRMRDLYDAADVGENGIVWLLKPPGSVLLREPRSAKPNDEPWPTIALTTTNGEHTGTVISSIENGGEDYLTVYRTEERTGLTIAVSLALSEILVPWWNEVYAAVALTLLVGLVLLAAAAIVSRTTRAGETTLDEAKDGAL